MRLMQRVEAIVEPDYFQFYARRAGAEWASDQTTSTGYEEHLWTNGKFVTIGMARKFGTTRVDVEVWSAAPGEPPDEWQHVAEISLLPGGPLELFSWGDDRPVLVISIDDGPVRVREGRPAAPSLHPAVLPAPLRGQRREPRASPNR